MTAVVFDKAVAVRKAATTRSFRFAYIVGGAAEWADSSGDANRIRRPWPLC